MNLLKNSQYSWNIFFSRRSVWVLLQFVHRWTQTYQNWPGETQNRTNLHLEPHDNRIIQCTAAPSPQEKIGEIFLSLPDFFWGEGGVCTQATKGFITLIYVISMEFLSLRRRRFSCIKAWLTMQTALRRNLYSLSKRRTLFPYLISLETRTRW